MKNNKTFLWLLLLLGILIVIYLPVLKKLIYRWNHGDNSYCYLIPIIFLYLCWEKRKSFDFTSFSGSYAGLILLLFAICISFIGSISSLETFFYLGFYLSLIALGLTLYGKRLKHLAFPLLILFFIIPLPPFINRLLTFKLQLLTSSLAVSLIRLSGFSVFHEGNIIDLGITQLQVAEACSGLRYFFPMIFLSLLIGYYFLHKLWSRIVLLLLVPLICIIANALRIYLTAFLYLKGYYRLAQGFSHFFAGWLIFILASFLLLLIALLLKKLEGKKTGIKISSEIKPAKFVSQKIYMVSFLLITVIGGIGLHIFPKTFFIPKKIDLSSFPLHIDGWYGERLRLSKKILKSLWADDYVYNVYIKDGFPGVIYVFIPYYKYQTIWHTAHTPQSCILGGGWAIIKSGKWKLRVSSDKIIPIKYMWLTKSGDRMLATYFFFERGRVIISPWWHKIYLFWDGLTHRRTDGALVRVEMLLKSDISYSQAEKELKKFLFNIWSILNKTII